MTNADLQTALLDAVTAASDIFDDEPTDAAEFVDASTKTLRAWRKAKLVIDALSVNFIGRTTTAKGKKRGD